MNADYPATCVGGNTETHIRIAYTIIAALSQCVPDRAFATDAGTHSNFLFGATDPRSGDYVVCYDFTCAAWGGRSFADGNEVINCINGNSRMVPIEVFEVRYPWMIEEYALQPDTAGPGRFRGAHALAKVLRCMDTEITVSSVSDRHKMRPWGLLGGGPGRRAASSTGLRGATTGNPSPRPSARPRPASSPIRRSRPGDRVRLIAPGAGGYGDVAERDPAMIAEDLSEGWITPEGARRDYGYG